MRKALESSYPPKLEGARPAVCWILGSRRGRLWPMLVVANINFCVRKIGDPASRRVKCFGISRRVGASEQAMPCAARPITGIGQRLLDSILHGRRFQQFEAVSRCVAVIVVAALVAFLFLASGLWQSSLKSCNATDVRGARIGKVNHCLTRSTMSHLASSF